MLQSKLSLASVSRISLAQYSVTVPGNNLMGVANETPDFINS